MGGTYHGEVLNKQAHGQGTCVYDDGARYEGAWLAGHRHGLGIYVWSNGDRYQGAWQRDKKQGHGTLTWADGTKHVGLFQDNEVSGHGRRFYPDGSIYEGDWKDGKQNGQGKLTFASGAVYVGQFSSGLANGPGEITFSNGNHYVGEWKDGLLDGHGKYSVPHGYVYEGRWKANHYIGPHSRGPLVAHNMGSVLQQVADEGKSVVTWLRGESLNRIVAYPSASPAPPCEVMQTTLERERSALAELQAKGRELVAAVGGAGGELALLVRVNPETQSDVTRDYQSTLTSHFPHVDALNRDGRLVAYACVPADTQTGTPAQHLLIWDTAQRAEHQVISFTAAEVGERVPELNRKGQEELLQGTDDPRGPWLVVACAGDAQGYRCVLWRPLEVDAGRGGISEASNISKTSKAQRVNALLDTARPSAAAAIEALGSQHPVEEQGALQALAAALRQHAAAPWEAYQGVAAAIARPPAGIDQGSLRACLQQLMRQDLQANRLSAVCAAVQAARATASEPVSNALVPEPPAAESVAVLSAAMLLACEVHALSAATPLQAAIAARSVEATAFLSVLAGSEPDAAVQALADATGLPALAAVAAGDLEGLRQWERLGPRARNALQWAAQRAAVQSQAASEALAARLASLLGATPAEIAALRRFVQQADAWINFPGKAAPGLLALERYRSDGEKRDDMERNRFAGHYHDGPLPPEDLPKYGWLNLNKTRLGLSHFGDNALVLKPHLQLRSSLVLRDHHENNRTVGTWLCMDHLLLALSDRMLRSLWAAYRGERLDRPQQIVDVFHDYVEVQVHGPVGLREDVRKVVASTTALTGADALPVSRFAQGVQLPLRWRDAGAIQSADRPRYIAALGQLNLHVAAWASHGDTDRLLLHPASSPLPGADPALHADYRLLHAPAEGLQSLVGNSSRRREEIVGLRLDPPNTQVNGRRPFVTLLVRSAQERVSYVIRRTTLLDERLRQMEANRLHVCAYAQQPQTHAPLPLHVLVAREADDGQAYSHTVQTTDKARLDAVRATACAAGWTVCGLASTDGETFTLILRRPVPVAQRADFDDSDDDDEGDTTITSGEPLSTVPESLRFRDDAGHDFDVDELAELIAEQGTFKNFRTNRPLSPAEQQRLFNHPSGAGARLRSLLVLQSAWQRAITPDTRARVLELVQALESEDTQGPLPNSTSAVAAFQGFVLGRGSEEQDALYAGRFALTDTHGQPFTLTVMQALSGLQSGAGCSRATAKYLRQMMTTTAAGD